jgi:hypothetical protein
MVSPANFFSALKYKLFNHLKDKDNLRIEKEH